jgi:signal transduction histidine kinase
VKKILLLFVLIFLSCISLKAQQPKIDSLQHLLLKTKSDSRKIVLLNEIARIYLSPLTLDTSKAKVAVEKMQQLSDAANIPRGKVFGMLRESSLLRNRKRNDDAIKLLDDCKTFCEKNKLPNEMAEAMVLKAAVIQANKKYEDAIKLFEEALSLSKNLKDTFQLIGAYRGLGFCYYSLASYDSSVKYYNMLKDLSCPKNETNFCAHAGSMLGIMYSMRGDYKEAVSVNALALAQYEMLGSKAQMANVLNNLANSYRFLGKYEQALQQYYKAIAIREELRDSSQLASPVFNAADILKATGQKEKASEYYRRSLAISTRMGNKNMQAISYGGIADMFRDEKELDSALAFHKRALELFEETKDKASIPQSMVSIGIIYLEQNKFDEALSYFTKAKPLLEEAGLKQNLSQLYSNLGKIYLQQEKLNNAADNNQKAFDIANEIHYVEGIWVFGTKLSEIFRRLGNYAKAIEYAEIARVANDSLINMERIKSVQELTEKYETEKKEQQITLLEKQQLISRMDINLQQEKIRRQELLDKEKTQQLTLVSKDNEIKGLEIEKQKQESVKSAAELALLQKDNEIKTANELRAKQMRNFSFAGIAVLVLFGGFTFYRYKQRKFLSEKLSTSLTELKAAQQQLIEIERQREQENVRLRISRDIHDEIGSSLTKIALLSEMASDEIATKPAETKESLQSIAEYSRNVNSSLSEIVWATNPQQDTLDRLLAFMRNHINTFLDDTGIEYKINFPEAVADRHINPELKRSLFLVLKESLNNAVKHSGAKNIAVDFTVNGNDFDFNMTDDGKGFDAAKQFESGNGIANMRYRVEQCNCRFSISTSHGGGCAIRVSGSLA